MPAQINVSVSVSVHTLKCTTGTNTLVTQVNVSVSVSVHTLKCTTITNAFVTQVNVSVSVSVVYTQKVHIIHQHISNNSYNGNEKIMIQRISTAPFPCETCSIVLNKCKYKNTKQVHFRTPKTECVQTIMVKHPTEEQRWSLKMKIKERT